MAERRPTSQEINRREDRWNTLWAFAPLAMLAIGTVLALTRAGEPGTAKLVSLAIALTTAALYLRMVTYCDHRYSGFFPPLWLGGVTFAGLFALGWILMTRDLSFLWYGTSLYMMAFIFLRGGWAYLGVLVVGALNAGFNQAFAPDGELPSTGFAIGTLAGAGVSALIGFLFRVSEQFATQRRLIIEELEEAHRQLEGSMAENAGLQRQLLAQAREAGVMDERQRLAQDIHDTLAQGLTGIITQLEAAEKTMGDDSDARRHLDTARRLARDSLSEARRSVQALRPEPLEAARLPDALADVAAQWSQTHGVRADVTVTGDPVPMHPEVEVALLRTAQEALTNVAKHAGASRVGITLSYTGAHLLLDVRDDGTGFDPAALPSSVRRDGGGFGLTAMRQRLARAGGNLEVESAPGQGTAISASVPAVPASGSRVAEAGVEAEAGAATWSVAEAGAQSVSGGGT